MAKRGTIANYTPAKLRKVITDTASQVRDDNKIVFGDNNDAHIEYNEDGDNFLVISGSSNGIVLSGSTIQIAGTLEGATPLKIGGELQFTSTGSAGAFNFGPNQEAKIYYSGEVANDGRIIEDMLVISGSANGGIVLSGSHTIVDSSLTIRGNIYSHGDVTVNAQDSVSLDPANNIILNPGSKTLSHKDIHLVDDKRLYFGSDDDAYIEYNETGDDFLSISGSSKGIVMSGSSIVAKTNNVDLGNDDGNTVSLNFKGNGSDGSLFWHPADNQFIINNELRFSDDQKISFGNAGEGHIEYNEDGDNYLVISGSAAGLALSGSIVSIDGTLEVPQNIQHAGDTDTKIEFTEDNIGFWSGGQKFLQLREDTISSFDFNPYGADIDFAINNNASTQPSIFISGSDGKIHSHHGAVIHDDKKLYFGSDSDASITYDEAGDDLLVISGSSQGLKLAGSKIVFDSDSIMSGTLAGPASYLGINSNGQLVLTASSGGGAGGGEALQLAAGNNISLDTDENGLVTISYLPAHASEPIPDDDSEAASIATGGALYWRAGSGYRMSLHSTGYLGVGVTGSANVTHRITLPDVDGPGGQIKANAYVSYSTRRLKKDIEPLQNSLEVVKNLQGVSYKWKDSNREDYGFIAEEVGKTLPGIVQWEENGKDAMSMDYIKIISFLVEAVKEQQTQIEKLNQRLGPDDTEE